MKNATVFGVIPPNHEVITFIWSTEYGQCSECGIPAAFYSIDGYGPGKHQELCAICAANEATKGAEITRIDGGVI